MTPGQSSDWPGVVLSLCSVLMGTVAVRAKTSNAFKLSAAVILIVFFAGFINIIPSPGPALATLMIDGLLVVMFIAFLIRAADERGAIRVDFWMAAWLLLVAVYLVLLIQKGAPLSEQLTTVRSHALYAFIAIYITTAVRDRLELEKLLHLVMRLGIVFSIFGIAQYVLRAQLPSWLLASADTRVFSYFGTDITRSNGLMGNTIVYSAVLLLFLSLWAFKFAQHPTFRPALAAAIVVVALLTTFSRIAIVGAVLIGVLAILKMLGRRGMKHLVPGLVATVVLGTIVVLALLSSPATARSISESFIVKDLFGGQNASVQGSTAGHDAFTEFAIQSFGSNPWTGVGIGSQSVQGTTAVQITDGANLAVAVEGGLALFIPWMLLIVAAAIATLSARRFIAQECRFLAVGLFVFIVYQFGAASFVNSAIIGKTPFLLFWATFGILMALLRVGREEASQAATEQALQRA